MSSGEIEVSQFRYAKIIKHYFNCDLIIWFYNEDKMCDGTFDGTEQFHG